ncbi:hypothetical protein MMC25_001297 [Agyrium rufum]|nr:hypothetical protein [Agyrium rufum]
MRNDAETESASMPSQIERSFSFNQDDETSLNGQRQNAYQSMNPPTQRPYRQLPPPPHRELQTSPLPSYPNNIPEALQPGPRPLPHYETVASPPPEDAFASAFPPRRPSVSRRPVPPPLITSAVSNNRLNNSQAPRSSSSPQRPLRQNTQSSSVYSPSVRTEHSTTTPNSDNLSSSAVGGGLAGIAFGIANVNGRDSGIQALQAIGENGTRRSAFPVERAEDISRQIPYTEDNPYVPEPPRHSASPQYVAPSRPQLRHPESLEGVGPPTPIHGGSRGSVSPQPNFYSAEHVPLADYDSSVRSDAGGMRGSYIHDGPYKRYSSPWDSRLDQSEFDPNDIEDDGDDGMVRPVRRKSVLGFGRDPSINKSSGIAGVGSTGAGATAATGGVLGGLGVLGRKVGASRDTSGQYGPVNARPLTDGYVEKADWDRDEASSRRKKMKWILWTLAVLAIIGIIVGGAVGGVRASQSTSNSSSSNSTDSNGNGLSAAQDDGSGDLDVNSDEIKQLLNNPDLYNVFPGMDYTPFNTQYPACLSFPPSQNNVTRDMAVLSQLTNAVRLYGTDCNQTEMVLHAIDKLSLTNMKIWLGVWIGSNETTNARQMNAMYSLLDQYGATPFAGVIVGNEVLFRKDKTEVELSDILTGVKSNFTSKKLDLPVATSDLGTDWTATLAESVDIVMSNIHPFFGGVEVDKAAAWTWQFWQDHDLLLTQGTSKRNIIAETGWPSAGGNDCGGPSCAGATAGSVAGIDEMNQFMEDFVCQSLQKKVEYFWFEAFDEPWKIVYDTPDEGWEDKWGLLDPGTRALKPGLKIPSCK